MPSPDEVFSSFGLDSLIDERAFLRDSGGTLLNPAGLRIVCSPRDLLRSVRFVIEREKAGTWHRVQHATGQISGKFVAGQLDRELARLGKPALNALPLEACLILIERYLALHGWGSLKLDLADADAHGVVVARLKNSCFAEALPDVSDFVDGQLAGWLEGFFGHLTGQPLGCEEIACVRRGAAECIFVITARERLDTIVPLLGREPADAILARLKT
jgi:predicted hydrocarbon binding protein